MQTTQYKTHPLTISEKQLQLLIINLNNAKNNLIRAKDLIPYDTANIRIHQRLSVTRQFLDSVTDDLNYFIYNV
jgi:hypothetical protein